MNLSLLMLGDVAINLYGIADRIISSFKRELDLLEDAIIP